MLHTKWQLRENQALWRVPQPLPNNASPAAGPKINYFGFAFDSPVPDVKVERKVGSAVVLSFSDCAGIALWTFEPDFRLNAVRKAKTSSGEIVRLFGKDATVSDYALRSKTLNLTPADLRVFSSPYAMSGNSALLMLKSVESNRFHNGLFHFETPSVRGFQLGDLSRDKGVVVEAYDSQHREIQLVVGLRRGKTCFSQADLNRIIFSLHPASSN